METKKLFERLMKLESDFESEKAKLIRKYCDEKNPYRIGDVFTDHIGSIRIESMKYFYAKPSEIERSCMVYIGAVLKADGTPRKDNKQRHAWQCNEKR